MQFNGIFNTSKNTKSNTGKTGRIQEERLRIEQKRYIAAQEIGVRLVNLHRKPDSSEENHILVMTGRNITNLSNTQPEHLQPMKGTFVNVTTVIKTTGVMNTDNLLI